MLSEDVKDLSNLSDMFLPRSTINQDVVEIKKMTDFPIKFRNTSSMYHIKVIGALFKPKGMINHSNNPFLVLKVILHTSVESIEI